MNKAIIIEGPRNVGKTFLINSLNYQSTYKTPFSTYFNESFIHEYSELNKEEINNKKELSYFSLGTDFSVLNLILTNQINHEIILDRNFLSTLVFGVQSGRITYDIALIQGKFFLDKFKMIIEIVFIEAEQKIDERNKDIWEFYNYNETLELYNRLLNDLDFSYTPIHKLENKFDQTSVIEFNSIIESIQNQLPF